MMLRALIVDDEPLARTRLQRLLHLDGQVEVIDECSDGRAAVAAIRAQQPDVVFLDVQMPQMSGFDVVAELGPRQMPAVVFVTAHDRFALQAFEAQALDYLLKPFGEERVRAALERTRRFLAGADYAGLRRQLAALLRVTRPAHTPVNVFIKRGDRVLIVRAADIDWVEAYGDYVKLHVGGHVHLTRGTLLEMAQRLDPEGFVRIHRSRLVNWQRVTELTLHGEHAAEVILRDGQRLTASHTYLKTLQQRLAAD